MGGKQRMEIEKKRDPNVVVFSLPSRFRPIPIMLRHRDPAELIAVVTTRSAAKPDRGLRHRRGIVYRQ
ncbi:hypothetical protein TIFTF001_016907 [Ficus carica]|uniref:Uncharacterized protein n=1 Tax=Ficus carica TaxID=3494 RepID=A0AA88ATU5_FICCA|nr:hypothetical protein TIFTF001_016907 [Ficus carica]